MTYGKPCEACLVPKEYRWAGNANTANRCQTDWKWFWQKAIAGTNKWVQNAFQSLRSVWFWENSELFSLWHCCRAFHRPHTNASCWKQWGRYRQRKQPNAAGWHQHPLGKQHLSEAPWLTALEGQEYHKFQLLLPQAKLLHSWWHLPRVMGK